MNKLCIRMYCAAQDVKGRFIDFLKKEKGAADIIAIVIIIGIVLVLAAVFWDRIAGFFADLMDNMFGNDPSSEINKNNVK